MPILTTSVIFLPVAPLASPERTASENFCHRVEHRMHVRHHVVAVDQHLRALGLAQRGVQHRAVLGDVDLLAGEHGVAPFLDAGGLGRCGKQFHRLLGDRAFRPVEQQIAVDKREFCEPARIVGESGAHIPGRFRLMIFERCKPRLERTVCHCRTPEISARHHSRAFRNCERRRGFPIPASGSAAATLQAGPAAIHHWHKS